MAAEDRSSLRGTPPGSAATAAPSEAPGPRPLTPAEHAHAKAIVASALASQRQRTVDGGDDNEPTEREVELAELEVRIRDFCKQLVHPTVRRVSLVEHEQGEIKAEARRVAAAVSVLGSTATKVDQQVATVEGFQEELGRWDNERRQFQAEAAEQLSGMRLDLDNSRYQLERQDCSIHSVQRTMDRVVGQLNQVQECSDSLRQYVERRLEQQGQLLNTKTTDLEVKLVSLEARHNRLSDDLWGEETGLAKVIHDLAKTDDLVGVHSTELKAMREDKASVPQLEAVQEEVTNLKHEANNHIHALRETVNTMIGSVKAHFQTATNTVAEHNAEMLKEVRGQYQDELNQSAKLRTEIMNFMQEAQRKMTSLEEALAESQATTEDMVQKVAGDLDEVNRGLRRDRNNDEVSSKSMQEKLSNVSSTSASVARNLEHLSSVMWMLLQCERAASALDQQDASDRARVALMGFRDGPPHAAAGRHAGTRASSGSTPRQRGKAKAATTEGPVISVDHRCLSCSGQAQTVLSGFKMACLQYTPGPVSFARRSYERGDLIDLRERLLGQAHEALEHGPIRFSQKDPFTAKEPPSSAVGPLTESTSAPGDWQESRSSLVSSPAPTLPPLSSRGLPSR